MSRRKSGIPSRRSAHKAVSRAPIGFASQQFRGAKSVLSRALLAQSDQRHLLASYPRRGAEVERVPGEKNTEPDDGLNLLLPRRSTYSSFGLNPLGRTGWLRKE